jgi:hypothetical protein
MKRTSLRLVAVRLTSLHVHLQALFCVCIYIPLTGHVQVYISSICFVGNKKNSRGPLRADPSEAVGP